MDNRTQRIIYTSSSLIVIIFMCSCCMITYINLPVIENLPPISPANFTDYLKKQGFECVEPAPTAKTKFTSCEKITIEYQISILFSENEVNKIASFNADFESKNKTIRENNELLSILHKIYYYLLSLNLDFQRTAVNQLDSALKNDTPMEDIVANAIVITLDGNENHKIITISK